MRNLIQKKDKIACKTYSYWIYHPEIASHYKPGQFVIIRVTKKGERIPLTIVETNKKRDSFRIIFQVVGITTNLLSQLETNDRILDVLGPLGNEVDIPNSVKNILFVGGGIGIAPLYSKIEEFIQKRKLAGTVVLGAKSKYYLILENKIRSITDNVCIRTDDGSKGKKGFVTEEVREILQNNKNEVDLIIAVGPIPMMKKTVEIAEKYNLNILVGLNTLMIDGTGMCGGCRISYDGKTKFTCVDGPVFDGKKVDFDELFKRNHQYDEHECKVSEKYNLSER